MHDVSLPKRFRILRKLGEGGMGVVYEAHDEERGARIALKTAPDMTPTTLARFKREFRALADVQHPNLVSLGELVSEGDRWFFTMELVEGEDFLEYVRPPPSAAVTSERESVQAPFSSRSAIAVAPTMRLERSGQGFDELRLRSSLAQLASALEALHAGGIVHRDVKPANIRVTSSGRLVLLDFGLAEDFTGTIRATDALMAGTPAYMAPEQAASQAVEPAADWYAVGALLHEALTGVLPFKGTPLAMMIDKQQDGPAPSASTPDVPADLDALCARLLRFDPKARPTGAEVSRALGADGASRSTHISSLADAPPFIGRVAEMAALRVAFADSRTNAVTVLVEGESGVGKSCLVRSFVDATTAEVPDVVVLAGRCYEREAVPYKAFDGVIDALTRFLMRERRAGALLPMYPGALAQVFPVLRRVEEFASASHKLALDPLEIRSRAFAALRDVLTRLGQRRALIVAIDDLHWADADSLTLLAEMLRPPEAPAMLLVATLRASPQGADATVPAKTVALADILKRVPGDVRRVLVSRLPEEEARELAARLLRRAASAAGGATAEAIAHEARGHPFFIDALVRHAALGGAAEAGGLEEALWASVTRLDLAERGIVEILAVAASPVAQEVLALAADVTPDACARHLGRLRAAHLISVSGARIADTAEPYHDRVRAAVLAHLDEGARARCHSALARALERTGSRDVEALALHWRGAGDPGRAVTYVVQAADAAAGALAFERAAKLFETALELGHFGADERSALLEKLGDALANAGRGPEAAEAYREAATGANAARGLALRCRVATELLRSGHFDTGTDAAARVLAEVGLQMPRSPAWTLLLLFFWRAVNVLSGFRFHPRDSTLVSARDLTRVDVCKSMAAHLAFSDPTLGTMFQQRYVFHALRCGEPLRFAHALTQEAIFSSTSGTRSSQRTVAVIAHARELADSVQDQRTSAFALASSAIASYLGAGKFADALGGCDEATRAYIECTGVSWELAVTQLYSVYALVYLGRWDEVGARVDRLLTNAGPRGDLFTVVNCTVGIPGCAWLARDEPGELRRRVGDAMRSFDDRRFRLERYYEVVSLALADLYQGAARDAVARLERIWRPLGRSLVLRVQALRVEGGDLRARAVLALASQREGRERRALAARARRIAHSLHGEKVAWGDCLALLLEGGAAHLNGESREAERLMRDAAFRCDAADMALHAAVARYALGGVLGGEEGRALVNGGEAWMRGRGIKRPDRIAAMLAPAFAKVE